MSLNLQELGLDPFVVHFVRIEKDHSVRSNATLVGSYCSVGILKRQQNRTAWSMSV